MLNSMSNGRFVPGDSLLHRSDPRTKIVLTVVFALVVFMVRSPLILLLMLLFSFGIARQIGRPLRHSLRGLKPIVYLAAFTAIAQLFFGGGSVLAETGVLSHISRDGAGRSLLMILRLTVLVNGTSLLTVTTTPLTLTDGLQWLLKPLQRLGLQVNGIATIMSLALRFIPTIADEANKLIKEQHAKSEQFASGSLLRRSRLCLPLIMPLFASVVQRGDALATAMDARCFGACKPRTRMHPLRFSSLDIIIAGVVLAFFITLVYIDRFWVSNS